MLCVLKRNPSKSGFCVSKTLAYLTLCVVVGDCFGTEMGMLRELSILLAACFLTRQIVIFFDASEQKKITNFFSILPTCVSTVPWSDQQFSTQVLLW